MQRNNKIYKLRLEGKTLRQIGSKFNITFQAVQNILRTHFPDYKYVRPTKISKKCLACGTNFLTVPSYSNRSFCSRKCSGIASRKPADVKRELRRLYRLRYYRSTNGNRIIRKLCKDSYFKFKKKASARAVLNQAIKNGTIVKPKQCSMCGETKNRIEGHHPNHSKPLKVIWLCKVCHYAEDKRLRSL